MGFFPGLGSLLAFLDAAFDAGLEEFLGGLFTNERLRPGELNLLCC